MADAPRDPTTREPLDRETAQRMSRALEEIVAHRIVRIHDSVIKVVFFQFMRGLAFGLGTVLGASILVSILVGVLAQIEFVPLLGDYAVRLIEQIEAAQGNNQ
jgi:hypothetical protein